MNKLKTRKPVIKKVTPIPNKTLEPARKKLNLPSFSFDKLNRFQTYLIPLIIFLIAFFTADLFWTSVQAFLLKSDPKLKSKSKKQIVEKAYIGPLENYESIVAINAFCPGCPVPDIQSRIQDRPKDCDDASPVRGLKVLGTIVLSDPIFSVAIIKDGSSDSIALNIGDSLPNYGIVFDIRRNKVCFEKTDSSLVFAELKDDSFDFTPAPVAKVTTPEFNKDGFAKISDNEIAIDRKTLLGHLENPDVLREAYALPQRGPDGNIEGFKIFSINPGSVLRKLGFLPGDVIRAADGDPIDSFAKVNELYRSAKSRDTMEITIDRDGKKKNLIFKVK